MNQMVLDYQSGSTYKQLAESFDVDPTSIMNWLRAIPEFKPRTTAEHIRIHDLRQDYFDKIDTQDKVYFLGLLFADGCNTSESIALDLCDEELVIAFRNAICPTRSQPIFVRQTREGRDVFCCRPKSVYLCRSLAHQGMVPKKSLVLRFPDTNTVPEGLQRHFIRGYFDGDGCVLSGFEKRSPNYERFSWRIVGTQAFLSGAGDVIKRATGTNYSIRTMRSIFELYVCGNRQVALVRDWLYADATISLQRKRDKLGRLVLKHPG